MLARSVMSMIDALRVAAGVRDALDDAGERRLAPGAESELGAGAGEADGEVLAEAAGRAGDQDVPVGHAELFEHVWPP